MWADERAEPGQLAGGDAESAAEAADRLFAGTPPTADRAAALEKEIAASARRLTGAQVHHLAHAIAHGQEVRIGYAPSPGARTLWVVSELAVTAGGLSAWCRLSEERRTFALGNILGVSPA